jgi:TonB family protein
MPAPTTSRKGLAIASLVLGLVGLLTAGGCGILGAAGLVLGVAGLVRAGRERGVDAGRDVAWAGVVTNVVALLTIGPVFVLLTMLRSQGVLPNLGLGADELPEPAPPPTTMVAEFEPTPTPLPPSVSPEARPTPRTVPLKALRVGGKVREPQKLRYVPPAYPDPAKEARVQGVVILEATISPEGKVTDVKILRGIPLLDEAAIEAVRQWVYTPTLLNGEPVPVIMTVTVNFRLQ